MSKDPFQVLADEVTLIRGEIERLQRTSLDKDEARALHQIVAKSVADLNQVLPTLERSIAQQLFDTREMIREEAVMGARGAAENAIVQSHARGLEEAAKLAQAAGEARRQAWRYFGGFWVWLGLRRHDGMPPGRSGDVGDHSMVRRWSLDLAPSNLSKSRLHHRR